jgi:hypothetical protein
MEFRRNPTYGHEKCFHCLLSSAREKSKLFIGINKIIAKALERRSTVRLGPPFLQFISLEYIGVSICKGERE